MGNTLYLWLNIGAIIFPILLSFDKRVHYVSDWKATFAAIAVIGLPFLIWDYYFTAMGVWGFNKDYLTGLHITNLPIEEVLFFVTVPFSCTFIYRCSQAYFDSYPLEKFNRFLQGILTVYVALVLILGMGNWYSTLVTLLAIVSLGYFLTKGGYKHFGLAFLLSMIPFFLMNGVLTGAITPEPVVWYSSEQIIGWRYYTIPIEDVLYSFVLLYGNIVVFERLRKREFS